MIEKKLGNQEMDIVVAPISGQNFVNQLAAYMNLLEFEYCPKITLSSSGGAVVSSLVLSAQYDLTQLARNVHEVNSSRFVSSWVPECVDFIPSWIVGLFQGSLYKHAPDNFFKKFMVPKILKDHEVWVMAYSLEDKGPAMFCSTSHENSILQRCKRECKVSRSKLFYYLDGDVQTFGDAVMASSSIPTVVPCKVIDGKEYADGGMIYASPFTPFREQIEQIESFHIVYLSCIDLDNAEEDPNPDNIVKLAKTTTTALVNSSLIQDRYACYTLIKSKGRTRHETMTLEEYFKRRSEWHYSMLEVFPTRSESVDITSFTAEELCEKVATQRHHIGCRVWYVKFGDTTDYSRTESDLTTTF